MYQLDWIQRLRVLDATPREKTHHWKVDLNVWKLGFTSFFTDISSEMVSSILPLYFISYLQFSPLEFGILDGIYQGAAVALLSLAAGIFADRWRRQKEIAAAGYGFSAISKLGLLLAGGNWSLAAGTLALDRVGKGVRTAPRDAMISLSSKPDNLATAFAVHRGLDAGGAVFGPLAAFFLLRLVPGGFDLVMMASFAVALIGVGLISLLVRKPVVVESAEHPVAPSLAVSIGLWRRPSFRALLIAGGALSLATASDGFLYLVLQRNTGSSATIFPLFAFLTALVYVVLSFPAGRLADRWGRRKVFLAGNALLLLIYGILLLPGLGATVPFAMLGLLGAYYAATDGVLAAMCSSVLEPKLRTSGLAVLNTVISVARFTSSLLFGLLWSSSSQKLPVWTFLFGLLAAMIISVGVLSGRRDS